MKKLLLAFCILILSVASVRALITNTIDGIDILIFGDADVADFIVVNTNFIAMGNGISNSCDDITALTTTQAILTASYAATSNELDTLEASYASSSNDLVDLSGNFDSLSNSAVTKVGTPVDNQIGVWTGDGTLEGQSDFVRLASGNVGIGTNGPLSELHISSSSPELIVDQSTTDDYIVIADGSVKGYGDDLLISALDATRDLQLGAGGSTKIWIDGPTGNVGIGTNNPSVELEVVGDITASGTIEASSATFSVGVTSDVINSASSTLSISGNGTTVSISGDTDFNGKDVSGVDLLTYDGSVDTNMWCGHLRVGATNYFAYGMEGSGITNLLPCK